MINNLIEETPAPVVTMSPLPLSEAVQHAFYDYLTKLGGKTPSGLHKMFIAQLDTALFSASMRYTRNNQVRAAKILGISRTTLRQKLRAYQQPPF